MQRCGRSQTREWNCDGSNQMDCLLGNVLARTPLGGWLVSTLVECCHARLISPSRVLALNKPCRFRKVPSAGAIVNELSVPLQHALSTVAIFLNMGYQLLESFLMSSI